MGPEQFTHLDLFPGDDEALWAPVWQPLQIDAAQTRSGQCICEPASLPSEPGLLSKRALSKAPALITVQTTKTEVPSSLVGLPDFKSGVGL
jgi:hypothetical protein